MSISLLSLVLFFFTILIDTSVTVPLITNNNTLEELKDDSWRLDPSSCPEPCAKYINNNCEINPNYCLIGGRCYVANQLPSNESFSCLQCQPNNNNRQWSFNPDCSADEQCANPFFLAEHVCNQNISTAFYTAPEDAVIKLYNFYQCGQNRQQCQAGFFLSRLRDNPYACCAGYFCPEGQTCMVPCRNGSYCPTKLEADDGTCRSPVKCPTRQPTEFEKYGCGGSIFEGLCPRGFYCSNPGINHSCPNNTHYCPTGVLQPLPCPSGFACIDGRARRTRLITTVLIIVVSIVLAFAIVAEISQWLILKKKVLGQHKLVDPNDVSDYFKKQTGSKRSKQQIELHIHLNAAKLRDVTRFDPKLNPGFTGRITAGRITALMGGSGCGKSSLLETIHGRRRLLDNGYIRFGHHEPLSNILTDYLGYVPQADIMHNDLTVFETVYYSARARRLGEPKNIIINDVCFVLKSLGLETMHNNMTRTLSGGQRKRVNVAMEVAACPKVILLDEPTSGLDTASCDDLFDLLQLIKYNAAGPVTIITVIHQPSQELFQKIDDIFFLTPTCCLAYQGPRERAKQHLKKYIFEKNPRDCPPPRHNDCDTCFIMLINAPKHIDNHTVEDKLIYQELVTYSWEKRFFLPFFYVLSRSVRQIYVRGAIAEAAYLIAYFILGTCLGYLFENTQLDACDLKNLPTIYFLISLAFGILTCISSQRLFGVETTDHTFERESRNYFHPFQYWLAKSLVDIVRLLFYPLIFLSMLYIEVVPRAPFNYYYGVMILLSFVCSGIGQLTSVVFDRTEYAYLAGSIVALLSCLLSGFSPAKSELGGGQFITAISFSRHVQHLLFRRETELYVQGADNGTHIWSSQVEGLRRYYSFDNNEIPYFWLIFIGFLLRGLTFLFLYGKSEYRSENRFRVTHIVPNLKNLFTCGPCLERSSRYKTTPLIKSSQQDDDDIDDQL